MRILPMAGYQTNNSKNKTSFGLIDLDLKSFRRVHENLLSTTMGLGLNQLKNPEKGLFIRALQDISDTLCSLVIGKSEHNIKPWHQCSANNIKLEVMGIEYKPPGGNRQEHFITQSLSPMIDPSKTEITALGDPANMRIKVVAGKSRKPYYIQGGKGKDGITPAFFEQIEKDNK